jgi:iron-sulfur cluster repair protein YtfE (RIC family)
VDKLHPSVVEAFHQAHVALGNDLRELTAATRAPSGAGRTEAAKLLEKAREHLTEHFRLEEEDGYMGAVLQRDPNQERSVQHLRDEHRQLTESLEALRGEVASAGGPEDVPWKKILSWVARVREHESRENALVQDAFNVDLSAED